MRRYGLLGSSLGHSFSAGYFAGKFEREGIIDASYENFELASIGMYPQIMEWHPDLNGLNVTVPYKQAIIPFLDDIDFSALMIRAVNTISFSNGKSKGYNTDYIGFRDSIKKLLKPQHTQALVLGTGGSSKAVVFALSQMGIETTFVSRKPSQGQLAYSDINEKVLAEHHIVINATPLGMHPNIAEAPNIPYQHLSPEHILYDLVYNPAETLFLKKGADNGAVVKNGLEMLELQAEASWKIWNGKP
ncbi:shikimate dehydrogenase [soil metagenome]